MAGTRPEYNPWLNATGWSGVAVIAIGLVVFFSGRKCYGDSCYVADWDVVTPVQMLGAAVVVGGLVLCAAALAVTAICWHIDHRQV